MQWAATDKDLVQSWMALKELLRLKLVSFAIPTRWHSEPSRNPLENGWKNKLNGVCTHEYFMNRVLSAPEDFRLGHDLFGADVMTPGHSCLNPGDLPRILAEHLGIADIDALFDPREVAKEVHRLTLAREKRTRTGGAVSG